MTPPRLLADEMLGRLARYLRMLGYDTEYVHGAADAEVAARARSEDRIVLTRDRDLARRADRAVLVASAEIGDQLRQLSATLPGFPRTVAFDRCTRCNGVLVPGAEMAHAPPVAEASHVPVGARTFACQRCGHLYWEGSHTASVRLHLAQWLGPTSP